MTVRVSCLCDELGVPADGVFVQGVRTSVGCWMTGCVGSFDEDCL